jgi:tRNA (cmo5U34)-methyltransferase|tara:strand:- start:261 stop:908 length:648 start_codon:yes stop_codon:yes gene_type:complete
MKIPSNWTFETSSVAKGFDRHVREQLPWYELATNAITHVARHYIPENGLVYDFGAATGNIGRALKPVLEKRNAKLIGIEPSQSMIDIYDAPGEIICSKAEEVEPKEFDLAILFLVLMFVEPAKRISLMDTLRKNCRPGGAIIVFDKLEPVGGYASTVFYRLTLAGKKASGTSSDEIIEKELSLSGVQRPITEKQLAGPFLQWFRFGDFSGYLIEK